MLIIIRSEEYEYIRGSRNICCVSSKLTTSLVQVMLANRWSRWIHLHRCSRFNSIREIYRRWSVVICPDKYAAGTSESVGNHCIRLTFTKVTGISSTLHKSHLLRIDAPQGHLKVNVTSSNVPFHSNGVEFYLDEIIILRLSNNKLNRCIVID